MAGSVATFDYTAGVYYTIPGGEEEGLESPNASNIKLMLTCCAHDAPGTRSVGHPSFMTVRPSPTPMSSQVTRTSPHNVGTSRFLFFLSWR